MIQLEFPVKMRIIDTNCKVCGKNVSFDVEERPRDRYPFSFIYYHGKPVHALISYIDANYKVRSTEIIEEFGGQVTTPAEKITKKCIVTGDWGVGKTAFIQRIVKDTYSEDYDPTVNQSVSACVYVLPNMKSLDIEFWDAPGQRVETFKNDTSWWTFASGADAVIIMGDVSKPNSFFTMGEILKDVPKFMKKNGIILGIANKLDLAQERKVKPTDLDRFCAHYKIPILELSVKNGVNVDLFIERLIMLLGSALDIKSL